MLDSLFFLISGLILSRLNTKLEMRSLTFENPVFKFPAFCCYINWTDRLNKRKFCINVYQD